MPGIKRLDYMGMNTSLIKLFCLLFVICLFPFPVGCTENNGLHKENNKLEKQPDNKISFRLKWLIYNSFASHFVAKDLGYFDKEGVEVQILSGGPGIDPIKLVATGANDVGLASYDEILVAREKAIPVIAIAEDFVRSGVGFLSLKEAGITKPQDFTGKKVAIRPGTDKHLIYEALMEKLRIDRGKIREISGASFEMLFTKSIDVFPGFITNQPFYAAYRGKDVNVIDPYDFGLDPGANVYFTSEETLEKKRNVLQRFIKASLQARNDSLMMPDRQVVDILLKYNSGLERIPETQGWQK